MNDLCLSKGHYAGVLLLMIGALWATDTFGKGRDQRRAQRADKIRAVLLLAEPNSAKPNSIRLFADQRSRCMKRRLIHYRQALDSTQALSEAVYRTLTTTKNPSVLGEGGMGVVYEVPFSDGNVYAVKQAWVTPEMTAGQQLNRLEAEQTIWRRFRRRYGSRVRVPSVLGVINRQIGPQTQLASVMPAIRGDNLLHLMETVDIDPRTSVDIVLQVAEIIAQAHRLRYMHGDLNLSQILLLKNANDNYTGEVTLLDWGLASRKGRRKPYIETVDGTPSYIDALLLRKIAENPTGAMPGEKNDFYQIGQMLGELLSKTFWYTADTADNVFLKKFDPDYYGKYLSRIAAIGVVTGRAAQMATEIVDHCMSFKVENRYNNATELVADLKELYRQL